jgi:hypothetical protein
MLRQLRLLLAGSYLWRPGAARDALAYTRTILELELTGRAYRMIRELIPFTQADGTFPADLEPLVDLVTRGDLTPAA